MTLKSVIASMVLVGAVSAPSAAESVDYKPVMDAVFSHMALTYMCRDDLGGLSQYQAARTIAIGTLWPMLGQARATLEVDEMDQRFRNDPRAADAEFPDGKCVEMANDSLQRIDVEKAKAGLIK